MAERRMFAKTITSSDAFLEMPQSSQCLYFHLNMKADDDGFVNSPKAIMREVGCKDDDMRILIAKKFIIPFESGVIVVKHWRINNYLRNDRHTETKYKEEMSMLELDENGAYRLMDTIGIPDAYQLVGNMDTQVRLGKDRLDQDSLGNISSTHVDKDQSEMPYQEIISLYEVYCVSFPRIRDITEKRKKALRTAWKKFNSLSDYEESFKKAEASNFLSGRNGEWTGCGFDWLINTNNMVKVLEGNYDNRVKPTGRKPSFDDKLNQRRDQVAGNRDY